MRTKVQLFRLCPKCRERYISTGTVCLLCDGGRKNLRDERILREKTFSDGNARSLKQVFREHQSDRLHWKCEREPLSATFNWQSIRLYVSRVEERNFAYSCTDGNREFASFSHLETFASARKNAFIHMCRYLNQTPNQFLKGYYHEKRTAVNLSRSSQGGGVCDKPGNNA